MTLDFEKGVPVAVDGEKMKASDIIRKLNKLGGENGIGLLDIVENRLVGMKDRGVYETPGGTILYKAHEVLEMITIDKDTKHMKSKLAVDFADLVYNGKWFTPLREALQAFAVKTQEHVTGTVKLKLYKGNIITASVTSPESLYSENLVTFEESDYNQDDATGFINLWGLPDTVQALREQGKLKKSRGLVPPDLRRTVLGTGVAPPAQGKVFSAGHVLPKMIPIGPAGRETMQYHRSGAERSFRPASGLKGTTL